MMVRRRSTSLRQLCNGPGKLTKALDIGLWQTGSHLGQTLHLRPPKPTDPEIQIATSPRIGITSATDYLWRFTIAGSPFVSRP
jgi:DNA-3-methyladenine glycosylase